MASETLYSRYRFVRFVLTAALAAWISCADMLATDSATADSGRNQLAKVQSQYRPTRGLLPAQFCRFVPCRSSVRTIEATDEVEDRSAEESPRAAIAARPDSRNLTRETRSFCIESPDYLIELSGTPPPVILL